MFVILFPFDLTCILNADCSCSVLSSGTGVLLMQWVYPVASCVVLFFSRHHVSDREQIKSRIEIKNRYKDFFYFVSFYFLLIFFFFLQWRNFFCLHQKLHLFSLFCLCGTKNFYAEQDKAQSKKTITKTKSK